MHSTFCVPIFYTVTLKSRLRVTQGL